MSFATLFVKHNQPASPLVNRRLRTSSAPSTCRTTSSQLGPTGQFVVYLAQNKYSTTTVANSYGRHVFWVCNRNINTTASGFPQLS